MLQTGLQSSPDIPEPPPAEGEGRQMLTTEMQLTHREKLLFDELHKARAFLVRRNVQELTTRFEGEMKTYDFTAAITKETTPDGTEDHTLSITPPAPKNAIANWRIELNGALLLLIDDEPDIQTFADLDRAIQELKAMPEQKERLRKLHTIQFETSTAAIATNGDAKNIDAREDCMERVSKRSTMTNTVLKKVSQLTKPKFLADNESVATKNQTPAA